MYKGFNLDLNWHSKYDDKFYEVGQKIFLTYENTIQKTLESYALNDGILDGSMMQSNWFTQIKGDIFI